MNIPAILIGVIFAALLGSLFHLIMGGGLGRLILFLLAGEAGFWVGQIVAERTNWNLVNVGMFHLDAALLGCLFFLLLAHWLSQSDRKKAA